MTSNEFPAEPKAFWVRATEPKSISALLASTDPAVQAHVKSIRDEGEAYFARLIEEHAMDMKGKEKLVVAHGTSATADPHTHCHVIIAATPKEEKP